MTLYWDVLPGIEKKGFSELPLFYGFRYAGCSMKYEILPPSESVFKEIEDCLSSGSRLSGLPDLSDECHILEMQPRESSEDWPYAGYPDLLPYAPLQLAMRIPCSPEDFQGLILHGDKVKPETSRLSSHLCLIWAFRCLDMILMQRDYSLFFVVPWKTENRRLGCRGDAPNVLPACPPSHHW